MKICLFAENLPQTNFRLGELLPYARSQVSDKTESFWQH